MLFTKKTRKESEDTLKSFCKASRIRRDNVFDRLEEHMVLFKERIELSGKTVLYQ